MKKKLGFIGAVFLFGTPTFAAVYDCSLSYEINRDADSPVVDKLQGVFDTGSDAPYLYLQFANHGRRNASISVQEDKTISLEMGDFCGDHYQIVSLPQDPGPTIKSVFSYGREGESKEWPILTLECHRR